MPNAVRDWIVADSQGSLVARGKVYGGGGSYTLVIEWLGAEHRRSSWRAIDAAYESLVQSIADQMVEHREQWPSLFVADLTTAGGEVALALSSIQVNPDGVWEDRRCDPETLRPFSVSRQRCVRDAGFGTRRGSIVDLMGRVGRVHPRTDFERHIAAQGWELLDAPDGHSGLQYQPDTGFGLWAFALPGDPAWWDPILSGGTSDGTYPSVLSEEARIALRIPGEHTYVADLVTHMPMEGGRIVILSASPRKCTHLLHNSAQSILAAEVGSMVNVARARTTRRQGWWRRLMARLRSPPS